MLAAVRISDIIIRYGGEEFLIFLTDCEIEKAAEVAEKLRLIVEAQVFHVKNLGTRITPGIGAAVLPSDGEGFRDCVKRAMPSIKPRKTAGTKAVGLNLPWRTGASPNNEKRAIHLTKIIYY